MAKGNRPERAADSRVLFPKKTFVESKRRLFGSIRISPVRKSAVMFGLIGNVGTNSLYLRLAWHLRFLRMQKRPAGLSSKRPHAQLAVKGTEALALLNYTF